jgi:hypothetical protein
MSIDVLCRTLAESAAIMIGRLKNCFGFVQK